MNKVIRNKCIEINKLRFHNFSFMFDLSVSHKCDHAGINFIFVLFSYGFEVSLYDTRHWDITLEKYED